MSLMLQDNVLDDAAASHLADLLAKGLVAKLELFCNEMLSAAVGALRLAHGDPLHCIPPFLPTVF